MKTILTLAAPLCLCLLLPSLAQAQPAGYRVQCDGNSCRLVPIQQPVIPPWVPQRRYTAPVQRVSFQPTAYFIADERLPPASAPVSFASFQAAPVLSEPAVSTAVVGNCGCATSGSCTCPLGTCACVGCTCGAMGLQAGQQTVAMYAPATVQQSYATTAYAAPRVSYYSSAPVYSPAYSGYSMSYSSPSYSYSSTPAWVGSSYVGSGYVGASFYSGSGFGTSYGVGDDGERIIQTPTGHVHVYADGSTSHSGGRIQRKLARQERWRARHGVK